MQERELRQYFRNVYHLAQQAAEAVALFGVFHDYFKRKWVKDFENATVNEDLLRIIASCAKRTSIVALHILCDNGEPHACNVYGLANRLRGKHHSTKSIKEVLRPHKETIKKIRTLRHNIDAHLSELNDWKKELGAGLKGREVNRLLSAVFSFLNGCGKTMQIRTRNYEPLRSATMLYGDRLIRALGEQVKAGKVGERVMSVRDWEEEQELQEAEQS
jgi:hypothetical protein